VIRAIALICIAGCASSPRPDGRAELALARTAVAREEPHLAIELYERVPRFSTAWPRALFESSRERVRTYGYARALGELFTLRAAPQLEAWIYPEAFAVEAEIYARNCYFDRARELADRFAREVLPLRAALDGRHEPRYARWIRTRLAEDGTLDLLRVELDNAETELARIVDEIAISEVRVVDNDHPPDQVAARGERIMVVTEEHQRWKFDGAFWADELGNYHFWIRSACTPRTSH
jgi:hypothetical protein